MTDVKAALDALLPPRCLDPEDCNAVPLEQDMRRNPHGLGRDWTPEQRDFVRREALRESIYGGIWLVPKDRRDDDTIIGKIVGIAKAAAQDDEIPTPQLETALEALWVRVIHAAYGDTKEARIWMAHAAGLLGEIR